MQKISTIPANNTNPILRIIFYGQAAKEPLIANLMQHFGITLNILQANIETLRKGVIGMMITEVINQSQKLSDAIQYLQQQNVKAEILGYVTRNDN